ncbi:MAG: hypothetical protein KAS32_22385, partial [Candidatus Peribacteraceae bacterium]|nr:hypothetical protein [Candidatus Peribacteraceae bacterium]
QIGDIGNAMYKNGLKRSIAATIKTITGQTDIKVKDMGLVSTLVQEFADVGRSDKWLNRAMKAGGFETIDRIGKSVLMNSSLSKFTKGALNTSSDEFAELVSKYRKGWGKQFTGLVEDLQKYGRSKDPNDITDNIRFLMWNELSDVQPISLSEVPEKYLTMPNGKIMYMLKTFMLKQFDILRVDGIQKIKEGETAEGIKNLTKYLIMMGGTNMGAEQLKSMLLGKEPTIQEMDDIAPGWLASVFKTFNLSEYLMGQMAEEGPSRALAEHLIMPPLNVLDDMFWKTWSIKEGGVEFKPEKATKHVPIVGKVFTERMKNKEETKSPFGSLKEGFAEGGLVEEQIDPLIQEITKDTPEEELPINI